MTPTPELTDTYRRLISAALILDNDEATLKWLRTALSEGGPDRDCEHFILGFALGRVYNGTP
jgi:hypothetical protein